MVLSQILPPVWNALVPPHAPYWVLMPIFPQEITNWETFHQVPEILLFGNTMPLQIIYSLWRVTDIEVNKILASKSSGSTLPISEEERIESMWREDPILLYLVLVVYMRRRFIATRCLILGKKDVEVQQKTKMCPSRDAIFIVTYHTYFHLTTTLQESPHLPSQQCSTSTQKDPPAVADTPLSKSI